jgi:hypothetical protein
MFRKVSKFLSLPLPHKRILIASAARLPAYWLGMRIVGFARLNAFLFSDREPRPKLTQALAANDIKSLVEIAAAAFPWRQTCLTRSLVLREALRANGIRSELMIGARLIEGHLEAHAWLERDSIPVNEAPDVGERFLALRGRPARNRSSITSSD